MLLIQGCSIQKMRYSRGFNLQLGLSGNRKVENKDDNVKIVKHNQQSIKKTTCTNEDSISFVNTEHLVFKGFASPLKKSKIFYKLNKSEEILSKTATEQKLKGIKESSSFYINKNALLGFMFGALAAIFLYSGFFVLTPSNTVLLIMIIASLILSIFAEGFSYLAIQQINDGDGNGKILAVFGKILGAISFFICTVLLKFGF